MTNILAIVRKEWRGYFASPIGYVVLGMYALVFGLFYTVGLNFFIRQSMAGPQMGGGPMNINQMLIRYVFQNSSIVMVFVVPLITMRTYAEEKRLGTVELLMTSPITDFQILIGQVPGRDVAVRRDAGPDGHPHRPAVLLREPGVEADPDRLPRPAAPGRLHRVDRPVLLEPDEEPDRRRHADRRGRCCCCGCSTGPAGFMGPTAERIVSFVSLSSHLDDFVRGVIDTQHVIYYLSVITFGLFLTAKSVDAERWRG